MSAHLGRRYVRVAAESLMAIHILLFATRPLAPHIKEVRQAAGRVRGCARCAGVGVGMCGRGQGHGVGGVLTAT